MIDLTKPIEVEVDDDVNAYFHIAGSERIDCEAYRQLFQDAPRTKLEHGKMLAMLEQSLEIIDAGKYSGEELLIVARHFDKTRALIAEIEAAPSTVHPVMGSRRGSSFTTTNIRPAPPLGEIEGAAQ